MSEGEEFLAEIPFVPAGKIDKQALRRMFAA
jgi:hypothetical protein